MKERTKDILWSILLISLVIILILATLFILESDSNYDSSYFSENGYIEVGQKEFVEDMSYMIKYHNLKPNHKYLLNPIDEFISKEESEKHIIIIDFNFDLEDNELVSLPFYIRVNDNWIELDRLYLTHIEVEC